MNDENKIDLIDYLRRLFRNIGRTWKKGVLFIFVCCSFFTFMAWYRYKPVYESKITFSVIKEYNGSSTFSYNKSATEKLVGSFLTIIESDLMVNLICQDLQVPAIPASFRVERIGSTNLFSVYARSANPEDAKNTLEALTRNYNQISKVALNDAILTVIEEPILSTQPSNQVNYPRKLIKGFVLGFGLYACYLMIYTMLRKTITSSVDIETYLHSRCLCRIPNIKLIKGKHILLSRPLKCIDQLNDYFSKLRFEIEDEHKENGSKVFMITSCYPHEGKSTIAANTGLVMARKGYKVLLLDFDLRNPSQKNQFDLVPEKGKKISIGYTSLLEYKDVEYKGLDVVVASSAQTNASEILSSEKIQELLKEYRDRYDYIIVDTPPIDAMADTSIVAEYSDALILVLKEDNVSTLEARDIMENILQVNNNVIGCVLNLCKRPGIITSYYGYRYGKYGYGYGYGYGKKKK